MIDFYLNQSITLKSKISKNKFNEATYNTSTIKARLEFKRKMVRNSQGQEVISEAFLMTTAIVNPDDVINVSSMK